MPLLLNIVSFLFTTSKDYVIVPSPTDTDSKCFAMQIRVAIHAQVRSDQDVALVAKNKSMCFYFGILWYTGEMMHYNKCIQYTLRAASRGNMIKLHRNLQCNLKELDEELLLFFFPVFFDVEDDALQTGFNISLIIMSRVGGAFLNRPHHVSHVLLISQNPNANIIKTQSSI